MRNAAGAPNPGNARESSRIARPRGHGCERASGRARHLPAGARSGMVAGAAEKPSVPYGPRISARLPADAGVRFAVFSVSRRPTPNAMRTVTASSAGRRLAAAALLACALPFPARAQISVADALADLSLREIGPAVAGGRIADIEVSPADPSLWYVAAGSGGVWKTANAGVTWTPVFDDQPSYSIGDLALDPGNPEVVWVGTGENVSGRHVAWGSGLYRSRDGGGSWEPMGLENSEHIGKILIHPEDGNTLLVAAEGPLWSAGGERGVYRTRDGGANWERVLALDEHTGVTDLEFAPGNPDVVYAAAFQRRRHVWGYMAGGPSSGVHKSTDGGESWREVTRGLPAGDMGKIGLAVTPADPDVVYATVEAGAEERGFYRSTDRGESWERRNSYISGGTGPHYYQEIEASPTDADVVIQMDVFLQITRDGGATFGPLGTGREKHSDNHALWFDPEDARHMLAGSDAGLYETFDGGETWRHFPNMPIAQFYKLALSNREPFFDVMGGAQDLGTLLGPSRTTHVEGVRNSDWYFPMGADGYGVQFDPSDPDVLYLMTQVGNLYRVDRRSEEALRIQPQPEVGDPPERWNWDSPVLVSPHASSRLYFASQRLWRSEDRGDSWTAISGDLTTDANRYELPFMGRVWELDALHDNGAMSVYSTIASVSESPVREDVLYVGTDDGLIHFSPDGGDSWARAAALPGVPERSFVNDVEASQHDAATVFAIADAHKVGDYAPYVFRSDDNGRSWSSISGNLEEGTVAWAIQQDHENADLLFLATERGLRFSPDAGARWHRLPGAPTIAFRDLKLHRRDADLVGATFGRGFYALDDYAPLREIANGALEAEEGAGVWPVRDAWWYVPSVPNQAPGRPTLGSDAYSAPNPPFGATFTYFLPETPATAEARRKEREREMRAEGADAPFPGYEALRAEAAENGPRALVLVSDADGAPVRWVEGPARAGVHRVAWDLRRPAPDPVDLSAPGFVPPWASDPVGPLAPPGAYSAQLVLVAADGAEEIGAAQDFQVKPVPNAPPGTDFAAVAAFQHRVSELQRRIGVVGSELARQSERLAYMRAALLRTPSAGAGFFGRIDRVEQAFDGIRLRLRGDGLRRSLNEPGAPSVAGRAGTVASGHWQTRQNPTATQRRNVEIAEGGLAEVERDLAALVDGALAELERALAAAGAPWTPGRRIGPPG